MVHGSEVRRLKKFVGQHISEAEGRWKRYYVKEFDLVGPDPILRLQIGDRESKVKALDFEELDVQLKGQEAPPANEAHSKTQGQ